MYVSMETADATQLRFDGSSEESEDPLPGTEEALTGQSNYWGLYGNRTKEDFENELPEADGASGKFSNEYNLW